MARNALRWFARGGTHLNYYMFFGGYNRRRTAAAGITNIYASDAPLCPSGQRRQPKFGHFEALHNVLAEIAPVLVYSPSALYRNRTVETMDDSGNWKVGTEQQMFVYHGTPRNVSTLTAVFVENNSNSSAVLRVPALSESDTSLIIPMQEYSAVLVVDGVVRFDSAAIHGRKPSSGE